MPGVPQLTKQRAEEFYAEHRGKPFFNKLVAFMTSGPIYAMILSKANAIKDWRALMGPTDSLKAKKEAPKRCEAPFPLSCPAYLPLPCSTTADMNMTLSHAECSISRGHLYAHQPHSPWPIFAHSVPAPLHSLRALYGTDGTMNATHGSDAVHTARREIKFFYPEFLSLPITDSVGCKKYIAERLQPTLIKGLTVLAKVRQRPETDAVFVPHFLGQRPSRVEADQPAVPFAGEA